MRDHLPWLCQGDIFASTAIVDVSLAATGEIQAHSIVGPAVLLTHGCDMDKPNSDGTPRIERMQLARLRAIESLPASRQRALRSQPGSLGPFEALYLGEVATLGESFIFLSDPYYVPAAYFLPKFEQYLGYPDAEGDAKYLTPLARDSRIGRLEAEQLALLRRKMTAFWARVKEEN